MVVLRWLCGCFEVDRRLLLGYFEILSDRFQVAVCCPLVALRFLSGCIQVALKSMWVCEGCCATATFKLSKAGLGMRSTCSHVEGCSDVALRLL